MNLLVIPPSVYICLLVGALLVLLMSWSIYKVMAMDNYANLHSGCSKKVLARKEKK